MISSKIIADSVNPEGVRLTSWILTYPRFIHSEFMTHRCFSRNAASSRAIPFDKVMTSVMENPAMPEYWGAEKKGMQSGDQLDGFDIERCKEIWVDVRREAVCAAQRLAARGLHKSLCNRLIEPWCHMTVLATATHQGLANFFGLRAHPAAQPEFQVLAYGMLGQYLKASPVALNWNDWHIPDFRPGGQLMMDGNNESMTAVKVATARCARLSYLTFEGQIDMTKDLELHDRLAESGHWSPFEHCARAVEPVYGEPSSHPSNFDVGYQMEGCGWVQYRKTFTSELQTPNLNEVIKTKPSWIK